MKPSIKEVVLNYFEKRDLSGYKLNGLCYYHKKDYGSNCPYDRTGIFKNFDLFFREPIYGVHFGSFQFFNESPKQVEEIRETILCFLLAMGDEDFTV
jgi:hypothetical protein